MLLLLFFCLFFLSFFLEITVCVFLSPGENSAELCPFQADAPATPETHDILNGVHVRNRCDPWERVGGLSFNSLAQFKTIHICSEKLKSHQEECCLTCLIVLYNIQYHRHSGFGGLLSLTKQL